MLINFSRDVSVNLRTKGAQLCSLRVQNSQTLEHVDDCVLDTLVNSLNTLSFGVRQGVTHVYLMLLFLRELQILELQRRTLELTN